MPKTPPAAILNCLPVHIRELLNRLPHDMWEELEEVRMRIHRPLLLNLARRELFVGSGGYAGADPGGAYRVTGDDLVRTLQLITGSSLYAVEEDLRNGFVTLPGGHRVGIAGHAVMTGGLVQTLKQFTALNIRVSREVKGAADVLMPHIARGGRVRHTLIVSPPGCGKTTILRDVVRQLSDGIPKLRIPGRTVGLVDERSEIAGCYRGVPQLDVGLRTDVLDACPKAVGMLLLLRALAPRVIATDEIGRRADVAALEEVLNAGVTIITTAHAASLGELRYRPILKAALETGAFECLVLLGRSAGPGTVEKVVNGRAFGSQLAMADRGRSQGGGVHV